MSSIAASKYTKSLSTFFNTTDAHTAFEIYTHTAQLFPTKQHVFLEDCSFPLHKFLRTKGYSTEAEGFKALKWTRGSRREVGELTEQLVDGVLSFEYEGTAFEVFCASWRYSDWMASKGRTFQFVFHGTDDSAGKALVQAVYEWSQKLKDEIWVFSHGIWYKDEDLYKAIQAASWDDIVLEDGFTEGLKSDTETFFASEDVYGTLNIAWKRGILLLGPPGNGKTQTIEALLKDALDRDVPCLYVKTFKTERDEEWGIKEIFSKAREEAPCILVLEDLDAMVASKLRSYFLNELDGLAKNHGILTLATSNHPERIDDAILRRPSRFDQKYTFALPTPALREEYSRKWLAKVGKAGGFDFSGSGEEALAHKIAERTEDWSFAFLKELFVSFLLRSASERASRAKRVNTDANGAVHGKEHMRDEEVLMHQLSVLAEQVSREGTKIGDGTKGEDADKTEKDEDEDGKCC